MKKFWENGGRVLLVVLVVMLIVMGVLTFSTLQNAKQKGEFAASLSAFRDMKTIVEQYAEAHGASFAGLCEDSAFRVKQKSIEEIDRTGILNWESYSVVCKAEKDAYAVSMTSFIELLGEPATYSHVCISNVVKEVVHQSRHIETTICDAG